MIKVCYDVLVQISRFCANKETVITQLTLCKKIGSKKHGMVDPAWRPQLNPFGQEKLQHYSYSQCWLIIVSIFSLDKTFIFNSIKNILQLYHILLWTEYVCSD